MNIARAFSYTRTVENALGNASAQIEELSCARSVGAAAEAENRCLRDQLAADTVRHAGEVKLLYAEIRSLRRSHVALVDRRALREGMIPPSESLTRPKLTEEEEAEHSKTVESARRSGPVAKTRQDAEAKYQKDLAASANA